MWSLSPVPGCTNYFSARDNKQLNWTQNADWGFYYEGEYHNITIQSVDSGVHPWIYP